MPLFAKKSDIPRSQFRDILKKTELKSGARKLPSREKIMMEKRDFPKRFGSSISKSEYDRTVNRLKSEKMNEQDFTKKIKKGREIKFLQKLEKE